MSSESVFSGLMNVEEESFEKILLELLDRENISMKTELQRPINVTKLDVLAMWLESEGMVKSANIIREFLKKYQEYMVSNKRQSRKEIIQAISEGYKSERGLTDKLMSANEK